jgi:hypothetical protein
MFFKHPDYSTIELYVVVLFLFWYREVRGSSCYFLTAQTNGKFLRKRLIQERMVTLVKMHGTLG